jgi:hypothetical protein
MPQTLSVQPPAPVTVRERRTDRQQAYRAQPGVAPKLANIENGEISLVPKLSDIWCRNSGWLGRFHLGSGVWPQFREGLGISFLCGLGLR